MFFVWLFEWGFPGGSDGKESTYSAGDPGLIPGSGRSPGEGHGYSLQYSCLDNPMDRGAWWVIIQRVAKSRMLLGTHPYQRNGILTGPPKEKGIARKQDGVSGGRQSVAREASARIR